MEDTTVTPVVEAITTEPVEGSIASLETVMPEAKLEETVPLSVYLSLKDDVKDLKKELKEIARPQTKSEVNATLKTFAEKYPDTDPDAIASIISMAVSEVEAKYTPIIERQDAEKKQVHFDKAFDDIYTKALAENPDVQDVDKEVIKALALTPQYNNTPVSDLIKKVYPAGSTGKATTENDMRMSADTVQKLVDIDSITQDQRTKILENPETRKAYFDKLDALGK